MAGALASTAARKAAQAVDIGYDYPGIMGGVASASSLDMLPGHATAGGGYSYDGVGGTMKALGNAMSGVDWGNAALTGLSLALRGIAGNNRPEREFSSSVSTLGPSATSSWSPATESLLKMLDNMQAGWTKYGK